MKYIEFLVIFKTQINFIKYSLKKYNEFYFIPCFRNKPYKLFFLYLNRSKFELGKFDIISN